MIFRKAKLSHTASQIEEQERGKAGRRRDSGEVDPYAHVISGGSGDREGRGKQPTGPGPYDSADIDLEAPGPTRVDLGGLVVTPLPGMELRLQVDEASKNVVAALLVSGESALELRAFAAPRSAGLWDEIRKEIAAETTRRGGMVTENTGPYGPELKVVVPVRGQDGSQGTQVSRIIGVDGPRWMLRATVIGRAANEPALAAPLLQALSHVVVVRGKAPMAPREMIRLRMPQESTNG